MYIYCEFCYKKPGLLINIQEVRNDTHYKLNFIGVIYDKQHVFLKSMVCIHFHKLHLLTLLVICCRICSNINTLIMNKITRSVIMVKFYFIVNLRFHLR